MSDRDELLILLDSGATLPTRVDEDAAGYDLYASEDGSIPPWSRAKFNTGVHIGMPPGVYGRIAPRSGNAGRGIDVGAGVVDRSYTGPLIVLLCNATDEEYIVKRGDRIAQLILEEYRVVPITCVDTLLETVRGEGGFGSSGR